MTLDFTTLLITMSFLLVPLAAVFFVERLRRPSDGSDRYWALVFLSALLCSIAYFISGHTDEVWWAVAVGNATMVFTLGTLWLGCRAFNGRSPFVLVVLLITAAVTVASILPSAEGSPWAGAPEKMLALGLFSVLVVIECLRPRLRDFAGARLLAVVLGVHAMYVVARSVTFIAVGQEHPVFVAWFRTEVVTGINIVLVLLGGIAIIAIRVQDARRRVSRTVANGGRQQVESTFAFRRRASARLAEAQDAVLVVMAIDLFPQLRGAYGLAHANGLLESLVRGVLRHAPDDALLGRIPGDRVGVLLPQGGTEGIAAARALAQAVQADYTTENGSAAATAVSAGIAAQPAQSGHSGGFELLVDSACQALVLDPELGLGNIRVAPV